MPAALVVLATYNQAEHLHRALRGYLRQTLNDFHLVVADDGSSDDTAALLEGLEPEFKAQGIGLSHVWQADEGFRKCAILNEAVRQSPTTALIIFTDGDCVPPAHFVESHLAAHEPRSFHVGGAVRLTREQSEGLDTEAIDAGRHEYLTNPESERTLAKKARQSRWGTFVRRRNRPKILGLNFALDRTLFEALNGFDENFTSWGIGEDSDIRDRAMRLRPRPPVKILYTRNDVFHLWHPVPQGVDQRAESRRYWKTARPVRCENGFVKA